MAIHVTGAGCYINLMKLPDYLLGHHAVHYKFGASNSPPKQSRTVESEERGAQEGGGVSELVGHEASPWCNKMKF